MNAKAVTDVGLPLFELINDRKIGFTIKQTCDDDVVTKFNAFFYFKKTFLLLIKSFFLKKY